MQRWRPERERKSEDAACGSRSIALALERFDDFRRDILAASHAAVSMVVQAGD
jgi:hypothetical protein